jgi:hypothetical protein
MAFNRDMTLENLSRMVRVIRHDRKLREWFSGMADKSTVERRNDIYAMIRQMEVQREDADLVASFQLLSDSRVFEAACIALGERRRSAA